MMIPVPRKRMTAFVLAVTLFLSCNQQRHERKEGVQQVFENSSNSPERLTRGIVLPGLPCRSNPEYTYSLYLPQNYDTIRRFTVMILLDPHGHGEQVARKYSALAEEFQFILIGSNDSRNGLTMPETDAIVTALLADAVNQFASLEKISIAGFSGGAKAALHAAGMHAEVQTVIYGGAAASISPASSFSLLGFAGVGDMNYADLIVFDQSLMNSTQNHFLIQWNGKHEWPDSVSFRDAFNWVNFELMKQKLIPISTEMINTWKKEQQALLANSDDPLMRAAQLQKMISFLSGLIEVSDYRSQLKEITSQSDYKNAQHSRQTLLMEETNRRQQYLAAFQSNDLTWWKQEISGLQQKHDAISERLLGFISLACYSISSNAIKQNNFLVAEKVLKIYAMADPLNFDRPFLSACMNAKTGNTDLAFADLEEAVSLGLKDESSILNAPDLQPLRSDDRMNAVLGKMRN